MGATSTVLVCLVWRLPAFHSQAWVALKYWLLELKCSWHDLNKAVDCFLCVTFVFRTQTRSHYRIYFNNFFFFIIYYLTAFREVEAGLNNHSQFNFSKRKKTHIFSPVFHFVCVNSARRDAYLSAFTHVHSVEKHFGNLCRSQLLFSDKLWTSFSPSEFFLKPFRLPLLNHPLIQRKGSESWLSFNAAAARTLSLNKVSVAWI